MVDGPIGKETAYPGLDLVTTRPGKMLDCTVPGMPQWHVSLRRVNLLSFCSFSQTSFMYMYASIEVALRGMPMEKGVQLGLGEGSSRGPISQSSGYHWPRVKKAGSYLHKALSVANFMLKQFTKIVISYFQSKTTTPILTVWI